MTSPYRQAAACKIAILQIQVLREILQQGLIMQRLIPVIQLKYGGPVMNLLRAHKTTRAVRADKPARDHRAANPVRVIPTNKLLTSKAQGFAHYLAPIGRQHLDAFKPSRIAPLDALCNGTAQSGSQGIAKAIL
jgi:hypothetical protein